MGYAEILEIYEGLAAEHEGVEVKGKANKYTSMNGNMFSFLDKDGVLCFRLGKADREALGGSACDPAWGGYEGISGYT